MNQECFWTDQSQNQLTGWIIKFITAWGNFLDSPESITQESLATFNQNSKYHLSEYMKDPSGWLTYNQFFARRIKPGYRPIYQPSNDHYLVSVCDSTFLGCWNINDQANISIKGTTWSVHQLLDGNPYSQYFARGCFMHAFLSPYDYHRFHAPITGRVLYTQIIKGQMKAFSPLILKQGQYSFDLENPERIDPLGFQFYQTRGLLILETSFGLMAILPVGMSLVSSVVISAEPGITLLKGQEFGYFQCGGSDYIILFAHHINVQIFAQFKTHYQQGSLIGYLSRAYPV